MPEREGASLPTRPARRWAVFGALPSRLAAALLLLATSAPCAEPLTDAVASELGVEALSPAQLDTLDDVLSPYRESPTGPVLDPHALDGILYGVDQALEEESLWDRFWGWVAEKLEEFGLFDPESFQPTEIPPLGV